MLRSNKYTRQVLYACLFTAAFFVGYAALEGVARAFIVPAGFAACLVTAVLLAATAAWVVRKGTAAARRCVETDGREGIVIYRSLWSLGAACAGLLILIFWDARDLPLVYFGSIAACVMFCAIEACRSNSEGGVLAASVLQMIFPLVLPVLLCFVFCMTIGSRADSRMVVHFHKTNDAEGLERYMDDVNEKRLAAQRRRTAGMRAVLALAVLSFSVADARAREELLERREAASDLSMRFALLPVVFLIAVRLAAGPAGGAFLKEAFNERLFVKPEAVQEEPVHQTGAYLDAT